MQFIYLTTSFLISLFLTKHLITHLSRWKITDIPNNRSNHKTPVPRGGGIAIVTAILAGIGIYSINTDLDPYYLYFILGLVIVSVVSFCDDVKEVSIPIRLVSQAIAVYFTMQSIPEYNHTVLLHFLPVSIEKFLAGFGLLAFINVYNFMDGIDGLTSAQTTYIAIAILLFLVGISHTDDFIANICLIVIGACLGFMLYNWHPAKIFMGDAGSISLGLITGWMLINLGIRGYLAAVTIIPGYYLADGVFTILHRLAKGEKIWQPHSQHFFQQAVRKGKSHSQVTKQIMICNIVLLVLSGLSVYEAKTALIAAAIYLFFFIRHTM